MPTKQLTGETRYRVQHRFFGPDMLVLQVRETTTDGPPDSNGLPEYLSGSYWRDARAEDLKLVTP